MEFGFTAEQEKLRKELHEFYADEIPTDCDSSVPAVNEALQSFWMALQRRAGAKGYLTPGWAKDHGGLGLGSIEQGIVNE